MVFSPGLIKKKPGGNSNLKGFSNTLVNIQVKRRIQKKKRVYKRKEDEKWGFSETMKNFLQFKRVFSAYFKVAGMIHRIF